MSDNNTVRRIKKLRAALKKLGTDALVVTKVANVTYLTGFLGDDSWALVTGTRTYLLTDSRYTEQAKKECSSCTIIERKEGLAKIAGQILDKQKTVKVVGVEDCASMAVFSALKKNIKGRIKKVSEVVEKLREIKDEGEVDVIKKAADIAQQALAATMKYVRQGVSENELAGILNLNMRRLGGRESFETIVAFGANGSRPHHLSGSRKLKKNDTVLIDWGAKYKGYCSDLTRSFAVTGGKIATGGTACVAATEGGCQIARGRSGEMACRGGSRTALLCGGWHGQKRSVAMLFEKVYNAVLEAQSAAIAKVKEGVSIAEVDSAAREVLKKYNLPIYGHGTGHGLGLEVHERPTVSAKAKETLRAGQVITIEPGVYMPGAIGVRIEDDVLVTKDGCKILSECRQMEKGNSKKGG